MFDNVTAIIFVTAVSEFDQVHTRTHTHPHTHTHAHTPLAHALWALHSECRGAPVVQTWSREGLAWPLPHRLVCVEKVPLPYLTLEQVLYEDERCGQRLFTPTAVNRCCTRTRAPTASTRRCGCLEQSLLSSDTPSSNRLHPQALQLFQQILAHRSFHNTSIILFLNKRETRREYPRLYEAARDDSELLKSSPRLPQPEQTLRRPRHTSMGQARHLPEEARARRAAHRVGQGVHRRGRLPLRHRPCQGALASFLISSLLVLNH